MLFYIRKFNEKSMILDDNGAISTKCKYPSVEIICNANIGHVMANINNMSKYCFVIRTCFSHCCSKKTICV